MRDFLCLRQKFISPNRCFHLFKSNLLINTFLNERNPDRCWINNSRCPFFDSCDYFLMLRLSFHLYVCVFQYLCMSAYVQPNVSVRMVCLWRYLWPICAFVPSSNPITFLRWSMTLINVLCRGFSFTLGTPNGLFTYMSYWQHPPPPLPPFGNLYANRQFGALGEHPNAKQLCRVCIYHVLILLAHTQVMGILPTWWLKGYLSHHSLYSGY